VTEDRVRSPGGSGGLPGGSEAILVVEGDALLRLTLREPLEALGYTVHLAATGTDAVSLVRAHRNQLQLVMLDVLLPNMTGPEVLEVLGSEAPDVKVLLTAGMDGSDALGYSVAEAMTVPYLSKPWGLSELARAIRAVLDGGQPVDEE